MVLSSLDAQIDYSKNPCCGALCENPSGSPLPCGDEPRRYSTYLPNIVACAFVFHVRLHFGESHGSRGLGPRLFGVLASVADTIVVLVASVLEEAAVGPNSWATIVKRGSPVQQLNKLIWITVLGCSCYDKACRSQADYNDEWHLLSRSCILKCRLMR